MLLLPWKFVYIVLLNLYVVTFFKRHVC
jgi:hypothetical protein